ncbi:hypothetical protein [Halalkalibaculum sp. DA384]|uniref:hypothetical protein n=1 Tax=Halalkalibaculum sp. DA384 TaxID=3373606 RepID=UPI003754D964
MSETDLDNTLNKALKKYEETTTLRAAVQLIPYVGGPLDTLLAAKIHQERILDFLEDLNQRLKRVELEKRIEPDEEFYDFMLSIFEGAQRTRSNEKRGQFAEIVKNKILDNGDWEEAETATRLLNQLDDIHIKILITAFNAPKCDEPFEDLRVISIEDDILESDSFYENSGPVQPLYLPELFSDQSIYTIRMVCSELVSRGLLHDEGIGRINMGAMEFFVATDLANWFLEWIQEENT